MQIAVTLKAANDTARQIVGFWDAVDRFEDEPSMAALAYPPHVTLAIYDDLEVANLGTALRAAAAAQPAFWITFDRIRYFDGSPLVLWAAPVPSVELSRMHAIVHGLVEPDRCRPHYRPLGWVPHCTLGAQIAESRRAEAIDFANRTIEPFRVLFDALDVVRFPPVEVVAECRLDSPLSD